MPTLLSNCPPLRLTTCSDVTTAFTVQEVDKTNWILSAPELIYADEWGIVKTKIEKIRRGIETNNTLRKA